MTRLLPLVVLIASGCAHQDEWTRRDTAMQLGVTGLVAYDAHLTANLRNSGFEEVGPVARLVIGRSPDPADAYVYMASFALFYYLVSRSLPAKWRPYWQGFKMLDHAYGINQHCLDGLC